MKNLFKFCFALFVLSVLPAMLPAQTLRAVKGTVFDSDGTTPMAGVSVLVRGTNRGTTTDKTGKYSVQASEADILVFSFLGYTEKSAIVGNRTSIDIVLQEDSKTINEVVVTALGIKREEKSLSAVHLDGRAVRGARGGERRRRVRRRAEQCRFE